MMSEEWEQLLQYSREQRKPPWNRTRHSPESSDEWKQIVDAGIEPFERIRRANRDSLSMAERAQFTGKP